MINFRYHIVSLTAVFLALAVGIAMGTTFLNKATVDQLKHQIRSAEQGIDKTKQANQDLKDDLGRYQRSDAALTKDGLAGVGGQLTDLPVLFVVADGSDGDTLAALKQAIDEAGADDRGTLVVTDSMRADSGKDTELATALEDPTETDRSVLQAKVATVFATALDNAAKRKATSKAEAPAAIQRLLDAGFLRFDPADGAPETTDGTTVLSGGGYRYVFVSGPDPKAPDADFLLPVLRAMSADGPAPVVLASAALGTDAETDRTLVVGPVRNDPDLVDDVSTVDDLERGVGLIATVYAVRDLDLDRRGHYGLGDGVSGLLPTIP